MLRVIEETKYQQINELISELFDKFDKIDYESETIEELPDEEPLYVISNEIERLAKIYHKENHNDSYYPANWKICTDICGDLWNIIIELGKI